MKFIPVSALRPIFIQLFVGPGESGIWKVTLDSQGAGGPHTITATSVVDNATETITLEDVLFGDVWVCSGQSNMAFTVSQVIPVKSTFNNQNFNSLFNQVPGPYWENIGPRS